MSRLIYTLFMLLIVNGCATNFQSANLETNQPLEAEHGVVALHLTNNTDKLHHSLKRWNKVYVIRLDNLEDARKRAIKSAIKRESLKNFPKKINPARVKWEPDTYTLEPLYKGVIDSQVFVGSIPEGKYAISKLYSRGSDNQLIYTLQLKVLKSAGTFSVKNKSLTNLGTLVFQPLLNIDNPSFWRAKHNAYVTRLNSTEQLSDYVVKSYPLIARKLQLNEVLTWDQDPFNSTRFKLGSLSKKFPYAENAILLGDSAIGGIAGRLGQFLLLDKKNKWTNITLPTNSQIYSAISYDDDLIFGGEFGELFIKNPAQGKWEKHTPVPSTEVIYWLGKGKNANYALTKSVNQYRVYKFIDASSPWTSIGNLEQDSSFWVQNGKIFAIITKEGSLRIFNDSNVKDYNSELSTWSTAKGEALVKLTQSESGVLLGLEVSQWDGVGDQLVSFDDGMSWHTLERNLKWRGDKITDLSFPTVLADNTVVTLGRKPKEKGQKEEDYDGSLKIMSISKDMLIESPAWEYHGQAKSNCHTLLPQLTNGSTVYFLCHRGKVISTSDYGLTWNVEVEIDYLKMKTGYLSLLKVIN